MGKRVVSVWKEGIEEGLETSVIRVLNPYLWFVGNSRVPMIETPSAFIIGPDVNNYQNNAPNVMFSTLTPPSASMGKSSLLPSSSTK